MKKLICSPVLWLILTGIGLLITLLTNLNILTFLLSIVAFLIAVFMIIRRSPSTKKLPLDLSKEIEEALKSVDFSSKTVLVGTVRTAQQLDYCLKHQRYYVPAKFLQNAPFPLDHIALHEEDVGTEPGIRWFGQIHTVELIKRVNIPVAMRPDADPNEIYYQYTVESWQRRKPAITISGSYRGRPAFTCKFLLDRCTKSYQLYSVTSEKAYRLMCILDHIYEVLHTGQKPETSYRLSQNHILTVKNGYLFVTNNHGWIREKTAINHFLANPKDLFIRIKKMIYNTK